LSTRKRHTEVQHVDDPGAVGRRLREARLNAGLSQRDLSFPGCSTAYLSRIESGHRTPSLQLLRELARRLGVTEQYLAYGQDDAGLDPLTEAEVALRMDDVDVADSLYRKEYEADEPRRRAVGAEGLGQLAYRAGRPADAIELLEEASELFGEKAIARQALTDTLGRAYAAVGDVEPSIALFERALRAAEEREDLLATVRFSTLLSYALSDAGRLDDAGRIVASALTHADELTDSQARVRLLWAQARLHVLGDRPELAERYARKVIELLELTEDSYHLSRAYRLLATVELERRRPREALELLDRARAILPESENETEQSLIELAKACALVQLGELDEAASLAMTLAGALTELPEESGRSYSFLAQTFAKAGDNARAFDLYELACERLERVPNRALVDAYAHLAELLEAEGRKDAALEVLRKAVSTRATAGTPAPGAR
jgi:tetratricopeptide (TPR) repeat protein